MFTKGSGHSMSCIIPARRAMRFLGRPPRITKRKQSDVYNLIGEAMLAGGGSSLKYTTSAAAEWRQQSEVYILIGEAVVCPSFLLD
jgi:hypothetical protein